MTNVAKTYIHDVTKAFPVKGSRVHRFLIDFRDSVSAYCDKNENCTMNDLITEFGTPKDVAVTYFDNIDADSYYHLLKQVSTVRTIISGVAIVILLGVTIFSIYCKKSYDEVVRNIGTTIDTTIEVVE